MSRIIIKGLPKSITEEKLKNLFGQKGTITDVQLKYTKEGIFRQFAFVGYQNESDAGSAIEYFNNTCIQTSKIKVEQCAALGGQEKPKSWSKYSKDSSAYKKVHGEDEDILEKKNEAENKRKEEWKEKNTSKLDEIIGEHKDDPKFIEFMQAHDKNRVMWGNDAELADRNEEQNMETEESNEVETQVISAVKEDEVDGESEEDEKLAEKNISDLDYMKSLMKSEEPTPKIKSKVSKPDLLTIKMHNIPYKLRRQEILKFFKPIKPFSVRLPAKVHGFCYVGFKTEKDFQKAMLKDKSFIKGKQVFFSDFTEKNKISKGISEGKPVDPFSNKNSKWTKQEESIKNEEDISESGRIFFRNLAYTTTEDDIQTLFEKYGPVAEISLPIDSITRQIKGFGTVTFLMPEHAVQAFSELDGSCFHGRLLHLIPGKNRDAEEMDENDASLSYKEKKELKLKKSAQQSFNWNTLFLGANAVANILAKKFDTSKEQILDSQSGGSSAAVRLALGETQIVIEMKKFLEDNDISLDAFETSSKKRSKTVILAKNLPADTTVQELKPLFVKFGVVGRIVLPPSGVTALIEFLDPSEAKQAFRKLAYSKFKTLPLYLEWAPENTFKTVVNIEAVTKSHEEDKIKLITETNKMEIDEKPSNENEEVTDIADDIDNQPEAETTLFLRNLNFKSREDVIRSHFKHLGTIHIVQVAMRKDPENPSNKTSLGYGFIQFKRKVTAEKALKDMQFTQIEGNQVELKRSDRTLKSDESSQRKPTSSLQQNGTKLLVRNIPFQAKTKEVMEIFRAFGELRSVRLPKKMTPGEESHRGFGFVDFFTKSDAKNAFEALSQSTHLYGRRLVLEWASTTEDDVDELRKRTAQSYQTSDTQAKMSRKAVFDTSNVNTFSKGDEDDEY